MEKSIKLKVLDNIGKVYEKSKNCKLETSFFTKIDNELSFLSEYFRTSKKQSFFISLVFALNYKGDTVDLSDLIEYFDCNPVKMLEYSDDFEYLYLKSIFEKQKTSHRIKLAGTNDQFTINKKISEAILQNKPMPELKQQKFEDIIEILEKVYNIGEQRYDNELATHELFSQVKKIISCNLQFPLFIKIKNFNYNIEDTYLYLHLIWKSISGNESIDMSRTLKKIYDIPSMRIKYMQKILSKENKLIKDDLIEIVEAQLFNDAAMKLTEKSFNIVNECGIKLFIKNKNKKGNILSPEDIPFRKLFFNKSEMKQLFLLKDLLEDIKLREVQKRLINKNLPKGVAALLYGEPGTGKTEIVKQIAKETKRELMKVDISQSKSMWFGESEKNIKRIFTDYKSFAENYERTPILFFNEADALISKRRKPGSSSVAQTENTIQNILLEELENFEGILIATTNLESNFDTAFERRFLFKIQFQKPSVKIRAKIWKSKLPMLKVKDCNYLSGKFDFSGGQIENIIRKSEMHEIIYGKIVDVENIINFCLEEETLNNHTVKIGFKS